MTTLPLQLEAVTYAAAGKRLLDGISLTFERGPRTVVLGPNGAGKSLLLRLCHGLLVPTAGSIRWQEGDNGRRQAMVFQRPVMLRRSAAANIDYALRLQRIPADRRRARIREVLDDTGLRELAHHPARRLSVGEQQRLALARAWATAPEILFLDEPTASLDPGATHEIERIVNAMHATGTKIVMVTHNMGQARRMGDEVIFLHQGQLIERAPAERFFRSPATPEAAQFLEGELPW